MFYITISNGLLKDGHRKRMGEAVWEFMWLIDRITVIDEQGYGKVLGGKPIKLDEIANDLEVHRDTVSSNLIKLEEHGYIEKTRTPYGLSIRVVKAKKRFGGNAESNKAKTPNLRRENAESNKTDTVDNNSKTRERTPADEMRDFIASVESQDEAFQSLVTALSKKADLPEQRVARELKNFVNYWCEKTKSGRKQRWEMQEAFEVKRRIATWFSRINTFKPTAPQGRGVSTTF